MGEGRVQLNTYINARAWGSQRIEVDLNCAQTFLSRIAREREKYANVLYPTHTAKGLAEATPHRSGGKGTPCKGGAAQLAVNMSNSAMVAVAICCILVLLAVFIVIIIVVGQQFEEPK